MTVEVAPLARDALGAAAAVLGRAAPRDRAAAVAEEKLFGDAPGGPGLAWGAWGDGVLVGVAVVSGRWLRLLAVDPPARRRGAGTALLARAVDLAHAAGEPVLRTADQPGNYLTPGVDARDEETLAWLARRGFAAVATRESWRVGLAGNPLLDADRLQALGAGVARRGYALRRAAPGEASAVQSWVTASFGAAWGYEVGRALELNPPGVHVAAHTASGALAAFAAHDGNNRGLGEFGPAGTAPAHRGRGLGTLLLALALRDLAGAGHREAVIPWVGSGAHYRRAVGARPDRRFVVLERSLGEAPAEGRRLAMLR